MQTRRLRLLSANIQAGSSTRGYRDYVARSWSHVLPAGNKRGSLDTIAQLAGAHDIVGLNESDPGSLRSGFTTPPRFTPAAVWSYATRPRWALDYLLRMLCRNARAQRVHQSLVGSELAARAGKRPGVTASGAHLQVCRISPGQELPACKPRHGAGLRIRPCHPGMPT